MTPPVTEMVLVVGPIEPATKRGLLGVENLSAAARAMRAAATLIAWVCSSQPVLGEHERGRAEGVGLEDVGAGSEETLVHALDDVGPRQHEVLVAALQVGAAEVVGAEVEVLDRRAHGAVEDEDPLAEEAFQNCYATLTGRRSCVGHLEVDPTF